ncbi:2-(5''-triphosphoribosyl)-3'-dephosphocoenzyme-A synthase [Massilia sp. Bi118]|uniref:triphosphoribosyl-dephospho-CoA synthase MdcB n=1 Tax=Massilia sp. Bi118 TaxID=2822346 RepID=UPI001D607DC4|nr:triphosphoribosyl-dephospho-CoA synthase MdcB [Massilia sp. Bi118]CAH0203092.1 2-(5''-triphosphoribosyl)-3'-dephosphocoenzyme-A synthase [Massilia sp. Bi118]
MAEACFTAHGFIAVDPAATIARHAVRSLYQELALYPKPGLVSLVDTGSHEDMDASTFVRSLFSLRRYFLDIALAGAQDASFAVLRDLGIEAERRMLLATGGINTHRGAIFSLGMLCAAAGRSLSWQPADLRATMVDCWGAALSRHRGSSSSNGAVVHARHAAPGAREQAAAGFPAIFELALPTLRRTLALGRGLRCARIDTLFTLMAELSDTNVYHRGGLEGARIVRDTSLDFLARGGTAADGWEDKAVAAHRLFVAHRLSPGGAADLLAATCFVHSLGSAS